MAERKTGPADGRKGTELGSRYTPALGRVAFWSRVTTALCVNHMKHD